MILSYIYQTSYVVNIREKGIYNNVTLCIMITDVKHTGGTVTKLSIIVYTSQKICITLH